ncbi:MAG: toxin-antitoxin system YwqK family antitoxin [Mangrovibacterium sp.]
MKRLMLFFGIILLFSVNSLAQEIRESGGIYYLDSKPYTGIYTISYDNGNPQMTISLKEGVKDGEIRSFFENGQVREICFYKNNLMDGIWTTYNEKGIKVAKAAYREGKKHGEWAVWDDRGQLIYEMYYFEGQKAGKWKQYDPSTGKLLHERIF